MPTSASQPWTGRHPTRPGRTRRPCRMLVVYVVIGLPERSRSSARRMRQLYTDALSRCGGSRRMCRQCSIEVDLPFAHTLDRLASARLVALPVRRTLRRHDRPARRWRSRKPGVVSRTGAVATGTSSSTGENRRMVDRRCGVLREVCRRRPRRPAPARSLGVPARRERAHVRSLDVDGSSRSAWSPRPGNAASGDA